MMQTLMSIDQFGVEQKLQVQAQKPTSKSAVGGIMTIILYGASLGYFLSEFVEWVNNNKLPKITSILKQIEQGEQVYIENRFLEISSYQWKNQLVDPFDPESLIFYPLVKMIPGNWSNPQIIQSQFEVKTLESGRRIHNFYLENIQVKGSPPSNGQQVDFTDYQIVLALCNQVDLPEGFKCADSDKIANFSSSQNYLTVIYYITQFNTKTKKLYQIPKTYQVKISLELLQFQQVSLQISDLQTNDGILFNNINDYKLISDFEFSQSSYDQNYSLEMAEKNAVLIVYFTMNQIKQEVSLEYPNISEILANTGSIITWILQISFFVSKYNEKIFSQQTIKDIIRMYYPDIDELIIEKSFFGRILGASLKDKKYDPQKIKKILENLNQLAESKLNYINLQYEVSRIQLVLTETLGINYIRKHMFQEGSLEKILDSLNYNIDQTSSKSFIQINPSNQTIHPLQLQDSSDQDFVQAESQKQPFPEIIQQSLGLLVMKSEGDKKEEKEQLKNQNQERVRVEQ